MQSNELVSNRKATYDFEILETFEAGIVLQGTEIKSLRDNGGNLQDCYVKVLRRELWLVGCHISACRFGNVHNHEEKRDRKLLMHKREVERIKEATQEKGLTVIPLSIFLKNGMAKVKLAIGRGKKSIDKRSAIREREDRRQIDRAMKNNARS